MFAIPDVARSSIRGDMMFLSLYVSDWEASAVEEHGLPQGQ